MREIESDSQWRTKQMAQFKQNGFISLDYSLFFCWYLTMFRTYVFLRSYTQKVKKIKKPLYVILKELTL